MNGKAMKRGNKLISIRKENSMDGKYHRDAIGDESGASSRKKEKFGSSSRLSDNGKHVEKEIHKRVEGDWEEAHDMEDHANSLTKAFKDQVKTLEPTLASQLKEIPALCNFPVNKIWHLCIDGRYQDESQEYPPDYVPFFYDEPLFVPGVMRGISAMFDGLGKEHLTGDYLKYLHDKCVYGTFTIEHSKFVTPQLGFAAKNANEISYQNSYEGKIEINIGYPLIEGDNFSINGLEELKTKYACRKGGEQRDPRYGDEGHPVGNACIMEPEEMWKEHGYHWVHNITPEKAQEIATRIFDQYYREIEKSNGDKKKIAGAIVRCCQDLEQMHFFRDGNIRTIAFTILPKMLLENGFTPIILDNPNILDGMSTTEIQAAILTGQKRFKRLRGHFQANVGIEHRHEL
jgi:hypothetical protein